MATAQQINLSALTPEQLDELRARLEYRSNYAAASEEERRRIEECARLEGDFSAFVRSAWHVIRPGVTLEWSWHYDLIAEYLTLVHQRRIKRLIINISPRTLKSILVTVMYPVWVWTREPQHSFMAASYSMGLSTEHSVTRRNLIESEWFRQRWGSRVWLAKDQNEKTKFKNNAQAQMIATSVDGTSTGLGGNTGIVDDSLKPDDATSEAARLACHSWFDGTFRSRLNNPAEDALIVVEQRTGELDLSGHLLDADETLKKQGNAPEWTRLAIPLVCDEDTGPQTYLFPISGKMVERQVGDVLQPSRFPAGYVAALQVRRTIYATQYQQRPSPLEGNLIKRSEVGYYGGRDPLTGANDRELPVKFDQVIVSADCTFKDLATSDYVAIGAIGVKGADRYMLEVVNKHLDEPATRKEITRMRTQWGATAVLVEDKANGSSVIKSMKRTVPGVIAIEPEGGKVARMSVAAGAWQAGNWFVNRTAAWTEPFVEQITKFPGGRNDDMADMMSQAEVWLETRSPKLGLTQYFQAQKQRLEDEMTRRIRDAKRGQTADPLAAGKQIVTPAKPGSPATMLETVPAQQAANDAIARGEIVKVEQAVEVRKIVVPDNVLRCPICSSDAVGRAPGSGVAGQWRCQNCGAQFGGEQPVSVAGFKRAGATLQKG